MNQRIFRRLGWTAALGIALLTSAGFAATPKPAGPAAIPKWTRFELVLQSSVTYSNPLQEVKLSAAFISPLGETNRAEGFWDGGKTWRVRFAPDMPGQWSYHTTCSDVANTNLHALRGEFKCVAALTKTALDQHGPIRVARDLRRFEHADRSPFLWLGDVAWNGARLSAPDEWQAYSDLRASQKFTVTQWTLSPGVDVKGESAFTGTNTLAINIPFFQRLDAKVEAANRAGLVCAIAPLQELAGADAALSEEAAADLLRYAKARWSANHIVWLLAVEGDNIGMRVDRWKRIGRAVFANGAHAPVVLLPGETHWLLDEFREEAWLDAFALPTIAPDENGLQWMLSGPLAQEWRKNPPRPILNLTPAPEQAADGSDARRMLWLSLLSQPVAGASYCAAPVMNWETNIVTNPSMTPRTLPAWRNALFLPGVKAVSTAGEFFRTLDFRPLQPAGRLLKFQPGLDAPRRHIAAVGTDSKALALAYVPEERAIELNRESLPANLAVSWLDVRSGAQRPAIAVLSGAACSFPTPEAGDWLLVIKAGK